MQTKEFLKQPESTGLPPHISLAVDKSTPHGETNHTVLVILPVKGKRIAKELGKELCISLDVALASSGCEAI